MKKRRVIYNLCAILIVLTMMIVVPMTALATPIDENFDATGAGDKGTQNYALNGITYTTNDGGGLNISIVNDGNIASGGDLALGYRSSGVNQATQVTFGTADGSEFKLNSFVISTGLGDTTVTIKGYRDNDLIASSSATTASFTTFDVSASSNWEYIDEVRMTGADLDIDIDDIDFSPAVIPNSAPVLDNTGDMTFTNVTEDATAPAGDTVAAIIASAEGDRITDADGDLEGIAVTGLTGDGTWQYNTGGGWTAISSVSGTIALLLGDSASVRFVPTAGNNNAQTATMTFRAWDQTSGSQGSKVNTSTNGGTTAFSTAVEAASIAVTAVNDAPVLDNSGTMILTSITEDATAPAGDTVAAIIASAGGDKITDADSGAVEGVAVTGLTGDGTWQYNSGGGWTAIGSVSGTSALLLSDSASVRFVPTSTYNNAQTATVTFRAWDQTSGSQGSKVDASTNGGTTAFSTATETASISVTAVNDAPTVTNLNGDALNFSVGGNAITLDNGGNATVSDVDSADFNGGNITVGIAANGQSAEDILGIENQGSGAGQIGATGGTVSYGGTEIGSYAGGSGGTDLVISLNSNATPAAVQALLGVLTYTDSDASTFNTTVRTVRITINDGDGGTSSNCDISVTLVRAPTLNLDTSVSGSGYSGSFTEDGGAVPVTGTTSAVDDGSFKSLIVTVSNHPDGASESLSSTYGTGAQTINGEAVTISAYNNTTGTLTITIDDGSTTDITLQLLMESIRYNNTSNTPDTANRSIDFVATDNDNYISATSTATITVTAANDAPTVGTNAGLTLDEGANATVTTTELSISDVDSVATDLTLTVSTVPINGTLYKSGVALADNDNFTQDDIANNRITYTHDGSETISDSFTFNVSDGAGGTITATTFSTTVTPVNDAPTITSSATVSFIENRSGAAYTGTATDPEGSAITWSITGGADQAVFDIVADTGVVSFLSTPSFATPSDDDLNNEYIIEITANDGSLTAAETVTITVIRQPFTGGGEESAVVEVNGELQDAGTSETSTNPNGQTVTTITVDAAKLDLILNNNGEGPTVTLPSSGADITIGELNGQTVKNMENKEATLEVRTDNATYTLPASEIDIDAVSAQIGSQVVLEDISVSVKIAVPAEDTVRIVQDTASSDGYMLVVDPVEFEITCTSGDKTVLVSKFDAYVERTVAIPDGVDPNMITTGIVLKEDGSFSHVPTTITMIDGKYYAKINSLTNSIYSVIYNPIEFADVANHWAEDAINNMGSRLIVSGVGNSTFNPDSHITRAEFATIIVRALGLQAGSGNSEYSDVKTTDWYCGYIETASDYGLITGYDNGTFRPNDKITREQAMTIIARAMKLTELYAPFTENEISTLFSGFSDFSAISDYAAESIAECLEAGIVTGRGNSIIAPKDNITRAESAVIIERLLQNSGLI